MLRKRTKAGDQKSSKPSPKEEVTDDKQEERQKAIMEEMEALMNEKVFRYNLIINLQRIAISMESLEKIPISLENLENYLKDYIDETEHEHADD